MPGVRLSFFKAALFISDFIIIIIIIIITMSHTSEIRTVERRRSADASCLGHVVDLDLRSVPDWHHERATCDRYSVTTDVHVVSTYNTTHHTNEIF